MRSFIVLGFVNSFGWVWIGVSFTLLLHLIHFISIFLYFGYFVCIVYCSGVSYIYTILHWISHLCGVVLHWVWLYNVVYSYWFDWVSLLCICVRVHYKFVGEYSSLVDNKGLIALSRPGLWILYLNWKFIGKLLLLRECAKEKCTDGTWEPFGFRFCHFESLELLMAQSSESCLKYLNKIFSKHPSVRGT